MNQNQNSTHTLTTFEELQRHMNSFNVDSLDEQQTLLPLSLSQTIDHLASIYEMVEPVLTVVGALPILGALAPRAHAADGRGRGYPHLRR